MFKVFFGSVFTMLAILITGGLYLKYRPAELKHADYNKTIQTANSVWASIHEAGVYVQNLFTSKPDSVIGFQIRNAETNQKQAA